MIESWGRVAKIRDKPELVVKAAERCSLLKSLCKEIASLPNSPVRARPMLGEMAIDIADKHTFIVRAERTNGAGRPSDVPMWERVVGAQIHLKTGSRVNAANPDRIFQIVVNPKGSLLGEVLWSAKKRRFLDRSPERRPFFHPSTLTPKLASCMLTLARLRRGQTVLDPFCGAGSILIECELMGGRPLGIDISKKMVRGAMKNLRWICGSHSGLILGDVRELPIREVDAIVTDPPYGRLSSTHGETSEALFSELLSSASEILQRKGFLVTLSPLRIGIKELAGKVGLEFVESYSIYVHRKMTRELAVFRR